MVDSSIQNELFTALDQLPTSKQNEVLNFARSLVKRHGVRGESLLRFAGSIDDKELDLISLAIEEECEKVDSNDW